MPSAEKPPEARRQIRTAAACHALRSDDAIATRVILQTWAACIGGGASDLYTPKGRLAVGPRGVRVIFSSSCSLPPARGFILDAKRQRAATSQPASADALRLTPSGRSVSSVGLARR